MPYEDDHPSDQQLLLEVEGELSGPNARQVRSHVSGCWKCRARRQELEKTIPDFVRFHQRQFGEGLPPIAGPRALLKARLEELAAGLNRRHSGFGVTLRSWVIAAAACVLVAAGFLAVRLGDGGALQSASRSLIVSVPDAKLTPGAAVLLNRRELCGTENAKNKAVPVALQRRVFAAYGIPGAKPQAYEVDYLITPALGGADDIRNLWPHSYSATEWNALVKDALEDRLRDLVCEGDLDLAAAQREIADNWIAAYKKYFHTEKPLPEHYR